MTQVQDDIAEVVRSLSEDQRADWIRTVLAVVGTEPQRRAFICGYNGDPCPPGASRMMQEQHRLGLRVRDHLLSYPTGREDKHV